MGLRPFVADLHIHSVLSPCGDFAMVPEMVLERARQQQLDVIAVTDHNSGANVKAFQAGFQGTGITVLPGMEVTTTEEIHVLTFFDDVDALAAWQAQVYAALPPIKNNEDVFGVQVEIDAQHQIVQIHDRFFAGATNLSVNTVFQDVQALGGLCIPAHVDKPAFSMISQLGAIPPDLGVLAVEVYRKRSVAEAMLRFPDIARYAVVRSSDAHYLDDIGAGKTIYQLESPTIQELRKALLHQAGRSYTIEPG
jgi:3',5'-nucleoside bisphosphate phosphatase